MTDERERILERQTATGDQEATRALRATRVRTAGLTRVLRTYNVRLGFCSNSSSAHSVILAPGMVDRLGATDDALGFGWGNFVLASPEAKARYFAVACASHYKRYPGMGRAEVVALTRRFFDSGGVTDQQIWDGYIDHQSAPSFPTPRSEAQGMEPLWQLLADEIVHREDAVVLGGNDNDDDHPLRSAGPLLDLYHQHFQFDNWRGYDLRTFWKDEVSGHFVVFDKATGTRFRFGPDRLPPPSEATHPELVEVKITDKCDKGCPHCYMDSSPAGSHADDSVLRSLAYSMRNSGVMEVALGGGEPTLHPDFAEILRHFRNYGGVVPSFSTQSWEWLEDMEVVSAVSECCGAVALSTQDPGDVRKWIEGCRDRGIRPHFHYVLGISPLKNLEAFLQAIKCNDEECDCAYLNGHLVLLGYKGMGRAAAKPPHSYKNWGKALAKGMENEARWRWSIALDSALLAETEDLDDELGTSVNTKLYEAPDGLFSCFYDAVEGFLAPSSFSPEDARVPLAHSYELLRDGWQRVKTLARHGRA